MGEPFVVGVERVPSQVFMLERQPMHAPCTCAAWWVVVWVGGFACLQVRGQFLIFFIIFFLSALFDWRLEGWQGWL